MSLASATKAAAVLVLFGLSAWFRPAHAETVNCTEITSLPTVITTQGVYCLKKQIETGLSAGAAITVATNNVTIDCNLYKVGNLSAGPATMASGIVAAGRLNVSVKNCSLRGFFNGVMLTDGDYAVDSNRFDLNTNTAIFVSGAGSRVTGNEINDTGGSTVPGLTQYNGIYVTSDVDIMNNTINGVVATAGANGFAYGIFTQNMESAAISGNRIRNLVGSGLLGARRGIWNASSGRVTVSNNTVVINGGLIGDTGIRCSLNLAGVSRGNTVLGTGLGVSLLSCPDAGGNFVSIL